MRLATLTGDLEDQFLRYVKRDYFDYYFFIYDWLLQKGKTQITIAFDDEEIVGLLLIYEGSIVQVRGEPPVVSFLLENLNIPNVTIQAPQNCEKILAAKYPAFWQKETVELFSLKKGEENLSVRLRPQRLSVDDAEAVASLMREAYPEMWGDMTLDYVREHMLFEASFWLGIRSGGKLVSFGYATVTPVVSHVTWIATHPKWENRGYATSIVSSLVAECLKKSSAAVIYVMSYNEAAKAVYSKVGFKPYKSYTLFKT